MLCLFAVCTTKFKLNACTCTVILSAHSDAGALLTIWIENQFSLQITVLNNITEPFKTETINSIVHVYLSTHCVSKLSYGFSLPSVAVVVTAAISNAKKIYANT